MDTVDGARFAVAGLLWLGVALLWAPLVHAAPPTTHHLSLGVSLGASAPLQRPDVDTRGGPAARLSLRYRSPDGLGAVVSGGFAQLYRKNTRAPDAAGVDQPLQSGLDGWDLSGGLLFRRGPVRLTAGIGLWVLAVRATLGDTTITPHQVGLAYTAGLAGVWRLHHVDLDLAVHAIIASGTDHAWLVFSLGLSGALFESAPSAPPHRAADAP